MLLKLNVKKTKLLKIGKMQSDARVSVDDEEIEVVEHFKYLGSLKSFDGNCNKDTRSRIGMAKKRMLDLVPIWKDRGINKDLKMKLVRSLVWTVWQNPQIAQATTLRDPWIPARSKDP